MELARPPRRRNSILLTSLVDVLFVLLFFFMLTSGSIDRRSIAVGTPDRISTGSRDASAGARTVLRLLPGRRVAIDADAFDLATLDAELARRGIRAVVVAAGAGVPLQDLVDVIDRLQAAAIPLTLAPAASP